jgi:hypothetical protein
MLGRRLIGAATSVAAAALGVGTSAGTTASTPVPHVITCAWIAQHQAQAAVLGVSCDGNPGPSQVITPFASGCQRVPSSGEIGTNVYASSTVEYANTWSWGSEISPHGPYYWYLKHTDGSNQAYGYSSGSDGGVGVPGNDYYWEVQNKASYPQYFEVCYGQH